MGARRVPAASAEREVQELRYVKDMNLNAIRFEGKTESGHFWNCAIAKASWSWPAGAAAISGNNGKTGRTKRLRIAAESLRDQIRRIRNHPSRHHLAVRQR